MVGGWLLNSVQNVGSETSFNFAIKQQKTTKLVDWGQNKEHYMLILTALRF